VPGLLSFLGAATHSSNLLLAQRAFGLFCARLGIAGGIAVTCLESLARVVGFCKLVQFCEIGALTPASRLLSFVAEVGDKLGI